MNPMTHAEALKALFLEGANLDLTDRHAAQYALGLAGRIERTAQELIDSLVDGNDAMRAVADEPMFSDEPFTDQIRQTIAARKVESFGIGDRVRLTRNNAVPFWDQICSGETGTITSGRNGNRHEVKFNHFFPEGSLWTDWDALEHADSIPVASPEEDEQLDEIEARQVEAAHPAPNFAPLDMVSFAGDLARNLGKGA